MLYSGSAFAHDPGTLSPKQHYIYHRYHYFDCDTKANLKFHVDFKEVSMILKDSALRTAMAFWEVRTYTQPSTLEGYRNSWWLVMNNGMIQWLGTCETPSTAWEAYIDFLKANPEFLNVP